MRWYVIKVEHQYVAHMDENGGFTYTHKREAAAQFAHFAAARIAGVLLRKGVALIAFEQVEG